MCLSPLIFPKPPPSHVEAHFLYLQERCTGEESLNQSESHLTEKFVMLFCKAL